MANIGFRDQGERHRAFVEGTGLDVWEIIELLRTYECEDDVVVNHASLDRAAIAAARRYYADHTDEVDAEIAENDCGFDAAARQVPWLEWLGPVGGCGRR